MSIKMGRKILGGLAGLTAVALSVAACGGAEPTPAPTYTPYIPLTRLSVRRHRTPLTPLFLPPQPPPVPTNIPVNLKHTTQRARIGMNWWRGQAVSLSTTRPGSIEKEPAYQCSQTLYGIMTIGTMAVIPMAVCPQDPRTGTVYFDLNGNGDLTDDLSYIYGSYPQPIVELSLQYPEGARQYAFSFNVWTSESYKLEPTPIPTPGLTPTPAPAGTPTPTPAQTPTKARVSVEVAPTPGALTGNLNYYTYNIRVGFLPLAEPVPVALIDANNNGLFNDMGQDRLVIDRDGDGYADGSSESFNFGQEHFTLDTAIYLSGTSLSPLKVGYVSASGDELRLDKAELGTLTGLIIGLDTGAPLEGAKVQVKPGDLEATTDASGKYSLAVAEGTISTIVVTKEGYVPALDKSKGSTTTLSFTLKPASTIKSGTLTLSNQQSYRATISLRGR